MNYIKTKSAYVKQTKHSLTNDGGVIFERDNSTLGGINLLSSTQYPIYTSGNFIISVDNTIPVKRKIEKISWEANGDSEIWSLDNIDENVVAQDNASNDYNIVLKKDFFRLQDFAYYGSLSKLIESSLVHIINTFPGELYIPYNFAEIERKIYYELDKKTYLLGKDDYTYPISNPFKIDLHTFVCVANKDYDYKFMSIGENYKNYVIITPDGEEIELEEKPTITNVNYNVCIGDKICDISIGNIINCQAYLGPNREIFYMVKDTQELRGYHVRPKTNIYTDFESQLTIFENYLLSKKESIKNDEDVYYQSVFEILKETTQGVNKTLETFILPIDESKYNIDLNSVAYQSFVSKLSMIANSYDDKFTNNLYRSMTHESIKNFDWTFTREYEEGDEAEYVEGGNRLMSILNVCGRGFDNVKEYVDNINNINVITYDGRNNLPNYFLTDCAEMKGWDVINVFPFTLSEYVLIPQEDGDVTCQNKKFTKVMRDETFEVNEQENTTIYNGESRILHRYFSQEDIEEAIVPYMPSACNPYGEFVYCDCESGELIRDRIGVEGSNFSPDDKFFYNTCQDKLYKRIKPYYDKTNYNMTSINNEFLKRLCLNTPNIFKHKGTIDGIEEILGMFGMKSQRWIDSLSTCQKDLLKDCEEKSFYTADYIIEEYTSFTPGIHDTFNDEKNKTWINWLNGTKLLPYDSYDNYEGLPVISYPYVNEDGDITNENILYPYFDKEIDGNPYYQMKGGWLNKGRYEFNKENGIVNENIESPLTERLYTETHAVNRVLAELSEIALLNKEDFHDGDVMYVEDLNKQYVIMNGHEFYDIKTESLLIDGVYVNYDYITITASTNYCSVGDTEFSRNLYVSNPLYDYSDNEQLISLKNIVGNLEIKVYIMSAQTESDVIRTITITDEINKIFASDITYFINGVFIYQGKIDEEEDKGDVEILDEDFTNYFILHKSENCNYVIIEDGYFVDGWEQLTNTDIRYNKIAAIIEKNKGNNPHIGHNQYDMGLEYINYYSELFKYAYENNLINPDCFLGMNYDYYLDVINQIGFKNLTHPKCVTDCPSVYLEEADCKVHTFCDIIVNPIDNLEEDYNVDRFFRKTIGNLCEKDSLEYKQYGGSGDTSYHLSGITRTNTKLEIKSSDDDNDGCYGDKLCDPLNISTEEGKVIISGANVSDVTHQIVNIKRVNITFNMHFTEYSESDLEEKKYIESVILPYLEQMLPLNIICRIDYDYSIIVENEEIAIINEKLE